MTRVDSSSRLDPPGAPGALVGGRYRLIESIGTGSTGVVWAATDVKLGAPVALKLALPPEATFALARARFAREARIGALLGRQRGFVRALDWGELEARRTLYLVMDLVPRARPLDLRGGPLPGRLERVAAAAALVARVHARGIVHRDIKPANLLVCGAGEVHLTDFGLARELRAGAPGDRAREPRGGPSASPDESVAGTPSFVPLEQLADGGAAGPPADVFALGVILFLALTGRLPYPGETPAQVLTAQLEVRHGRRPRPSLAGAPSDVDPAVVQACEAAIALDPPRRPTAARLARTLQARRAVGPRSTVPASVRRPSQEPTPVASPRVHPTGGGLRRPSALSLSAVLRADALGLTSPEDVARAAEDLGHARLRQLLGTTAALHVKAERPLPNVDASAYVGRLALLARHGGAPGPVLLGRSRDADIVLPLSTISKVQLRFDRRGDEWLVCEEGSRNGTRHGRLWLRHGNPTLLRGGDQLCLSEHVVLEFLPAERLLEWVAARPASEVTVPVVDRFPAAAASDEDTEGLMSQMPVTPEPGVLEGSFGRDELIELLQMLEFYKKEGVLRLSAGGSPRGELFLGGGRVRGARTPDGLHGGPALEALLGLSRGRMRFHPRLPARFEGDLDQPVSALLLELMRQRDEAARVGQGDA